jgi:hypothetical protein
MEYSKEIEVVQVIDRKVGIISWWIKDSSQFVVFKDAGIISGNIIPVYVHRKEKSHVRVKVENEDCEDDED